VRLTAAIENRFGRRLPVANLFSARTVADLATELSMAGSKGESTLVALVRTGTQRPFFCVHPVGGTALCYEPLARALGPDQPFYGLQAREVEPGNEAQQTIEAMAEHYLEAMREVQPNGPYQLGGWSFGGLVAFEMARRLSAEGQEVTALVLLDTVVPWGAWTPMGEHEIVLSIASELKLPITAEQLQPLEAAAIPARMGEVIEEAGLASRGRGEHLIRRYMTTFKAASLASERYAAGPLHGSLTLLRAADAGGTSEADFDWGRVCAKPITVYTVPGRHDDMVRPPHVEELARVLRSVLDAAGGASHGTRLLQTPRERGLSG
jgi:thioesterase domain-containing protein